MKTLEILNQEPKRPKNFDIFSLESETSLLIERVWSIAQRNPNGFIIDINGNKPKSGYIVAFNDTQNSLGYTGLKKVFELFKSYNNLLVGGRFNPENNLYYFDLCQNYQDLNLALLCAKLENQLAIYDIKNNKTIKL